MNRKRYDSEVFYSENRDGEPSLKKTKPPNVDFSQSAMAREELFRLTNDKEQDIRDGILKSAQPTISSFPNRKRRSRNVQELLNGSTQSSSSSSQTNGQIRRKSDLSCVVCSDLAHGYNFDAISCESCKAFFRRNALFNMDRLKCRRDGNCEITPETRRRCKSCRLNKCFIVGMRKEWILTEEEKINKKRRIEENRRMRILTIEEGKSESITPSCSSSGRSDLDLQSVLLNKDEQPPLKSFESLQQQHDLIANVVVAFRDGFQLDTTSYGWSYPLARKITALCQILNTKNTTALRLISFYKRLREFDSLIDIDKVNLVKSNLRYMFFFHGALGYDPKFDVYYEENSSNDKPVYGSDIREAYGAEIHVRCTSIMRELQDLARLDRRFIQLSLVIFLFSKGLSNLVTLNDQSLLNYKQVFDIQNIYIEQLWLLMLKGYGADRAISMFSTVVSKCLSIQNLLRDIQQDVHERLEPDEVSPIMRSVIQLT